MTDRQRPLRIVAFSASIIADIDNPAATSTRALLGALSAAGHEVTHLERRGNPLLDRQLRTRGSAALRAVNARYPDIRIRQHDLPRGRQERGVWFGTEVSTADAVIALPGTPDDVLDLIAPFVTPYLVRIVPPGAIGDVELPSLTCVEPSPRTTTAGEIIVVAYDNIESTWSEAISTDLHRIVVGRADLPDWTYLPEVELAEQYRSARVALVLCSANEPESLARLLLPLAAGCSAVSPLPTQGRLLTFLRYVDHTDVATALRDPYLDTPASLPHEHDASLVATDLVSVIRRTLTEKQAGARL